VFSSSYKLIASAAAGLMALAGCATSTNYVAPLPVEATITNYTGKSIARVEYQTCGSAPESWSALGMGAVPSGGSSKFDLPAPCVNLRALADDGRVVGTQTGVRRDFPFKWTVS
jgi:hypothetical protein